MVYCQRFTGRHPWQHPAPPCKGIVDVCDLLAAGPKSVVGEAGRGGVREELPRGCWWVAQTGSGKLAGGEFGRCEITGAAVITGPETHHHSNTT